jgi:hypothetical protein
VRAAAAPSHRAAARRQVRKCAQREGDGRALVVKSVKKAGDGKSADDETLRDEIKRRKGLQHPRLVRAAVLGVAATLRAVVVLRAAVVVLCARPSCCARPSYCARGRRVARGGRRVARGGRRRVACGGRRRVACGGRRRVARGLQFSYLPALRVIELGWLSRRLSRTSAQQRGLPSAPRRGDLARARALLPLSPHARTVVRGKVL